MSSEKVVWSVGVSMVTLGVALSVTQLGGVWKNSLFIEAIWGTGGRRVTPGKFNMIWRRHRMRQGYSIGLLGRPDLVQKGITGCGGCMVNRTSSLHV